MFYAIRWSARRGLRDDSALDKTAEISRENEEAEGPKKAARLAGVRGETYGYWYLRGLGYVFVAKNYVPRGARGELDLVGYDGETLAFVEIRTRTVGDTISGLPELSVTSAKQHVLVRTAHQFLADRRLRDCPCRFDVLAIDNFPGRPPIARLHKDAFSPQRR